MFRYIRPLLLTLWYLFAGLVLLMAIVSTLLKASTPYLNEHKHQAEIFLGKLIDHEVSIGSVDAKWGRFGPQFDLNNIVLFENGKALFSADQLAAHVGIFKTIFQRKVYFRSLTISGSTLSIVKQDNFHYQVNKEKEVELDSHYSVASQHELLVWLLEQRHITLKNIMLSYEDDQAAQWKAKITQLDLSNADEEHRLSASLRLAEQPKERLYLAAYLTGDLVKPKTLSVNAFVDAQHIDLSYWLKKINSNYGNVNSGILNSKFWLTYARGALQELQTNVHVTDLNIKRDDQSVIFKTLAGHIAYQPIAKDAYQVIGENIHVQTSDHSWPLPVKFVFDVDKKQNKKTLALNYVSIAEIETLAKTFDDHLEEQLGNIFISGALTNVSLTIPSKLNDYAGYQAALTLDKVSASLTDQQLIFGQISGKVKGSLQEGQFEVNSPDSDFSASKLFEMPWQFKQLNAKGVWQKNKTGTKVTMWDVLLGNTDLTVNGAGSMLFPHDDQSSPVLSLVADGHLTNIPNITRYLPLKKFKPALSAWLTKAFVAGAADDLHAVFRGPVRDFPFVDHRGTFVVNSDINSMQLHIADGWPDLESIRGNIVFDGPSLSIAIDHAETDGILIDHASASIDNVTKHSAQLTVIGRSHEASEDALKYIEESPLKQTLGKWVSPFDLKGALSVELKIDVPFEDIKHGTKTSGTVYFDGNEFTLQGWDAYLEQLKGQLQFSSNGELSADGLTAMLGQHPLVIRIETQGKSGDQVVNVLFNGEIDQDDFAYLMGDDLFSTYVAGLTAYSGFIGVPLHTGNHHISMSLASTLKGMAVKLSAPLGKTAESIMPLSLNADVDLAKETASMNVVYGKALNAQMQLTKPKGGTQSLLDVNANLSSLHWPLYASVSGNKQKKGRIKLGSLNLTVPVIEAYGVTLTEATVKGAPEKTGYNLTVDSHEVKASVALPDDKSKPVKADVDYAVIALSKEKKDNLGSTDYSKIPPLEVIINRLVINQKFFGRIDLATTPIPYGLEINRFNASSSLFELLSKGSMVTQNGKVESDLSGTLTAPDTGNLLSSFQITHAVTAKKGSQVFNLSWPGSPFNFDITKAVGSINLTVEDGVIPVDQDSVSMGLSKVLGLFSAESLKRRLQLDFSDLTSDGYSFNTLKADAELVDGTANFSKGEFDGPQANIVFTGDIGIKQKDYNLSLLVTPHVTSALPLIATLAGGPIAGVATYAFDKLAGKTIAKATSYQYLLKGTWENPDLVNLSEQNAPIEEGGSEQPVQRVSYLNNSGPQ